MFKGGGVPKMVAIVTKANNIVILLILRNSRGLPLNKPLEESIYDSRHVSVWSFSCDGISDEN